MPAFQSPHIFNDLDSSFHNKFKSILSREEPHWTGTFSHTAIKFCRRIASGKGHKKAYLTEERSRENKKKIVH